MLKKCNRCKEEKSLECFSKNSTRKDGLCNFCKECSNKYKKKHYAQNRSDYIAKAKANRDKVVEWFREYKSQLACEICGENHPATLDFHHLDSEEKDRGLAELARTSSKQRVLEEMKKCVVWCSNCHRKHHWNEHEETLQEC